MASCFARLPTFYPLLFNGDYEQLVFEVCRSVLLSDIAVTRNPYDSTHKVQVKGAIDV